MQTQRISDQKRYLDPLAVLLNIVFPSSAWSFAFLMSVGALVGYLVGLIICLVWPILNATSITWSLSAVGAIYVLLVTLWLGAPLSLLYVRYHLFRYILSTLRGEART